MSNELTNRMAAGNTGFASGELTCILGALCHALRDSVLVESFVLQNHTMHQ